MASQNVFKKNFPSATCQHCNKVTDIQFSGDWKQLIGKYKTLSELNKMNQNNLIKWMNIKNCQIQSMHKIIAKLIDLMTDEQKSKAKGITQEMRDLIKMAEKMNGRLK